MSAEEFEILKRAVAVFSSEAKSARARAGLSRPEFTALAGDAYLTHGLPAWEGKRRRPRGRQGVVYVRALGRVVVR
jgi:DNA-binding transcriptional regulator YiaG